MVVEKQARRFDATRAPARLALCAYQPRLSSNLQHVSIRARFQVSVSYTQMCTWSVG